jgi:hypothetical protein
MEKAAEALRINGFSGQVSPLSHRSHLLTRGMRLAAATRRPPLSTPNWVINAKTIGLSGGGQASPNVRGQHPRQRCLSRCTSAAKGEKEGKEMKSIAIASLFVLVGTTAQAEIMCTERGGCWETGKQIRLLPNLRGVGTTISSRDGKGAVSTQNMPIANDVPHQYFPSKRK